MRGISLIGLWLMTLIPAVSLAESSAPVVDGVVATLIKQEGQVRLLRAGEIRKRAAKAGTSLAAGDMLITLADGRAELRMADGSTLALNGDTRLTLTGPDAIRQGEGSVYYDVRPRLLDRKLSVETDFVVIGVKGTTFIVANRADDRRVSMKEGSVEVAALEGAFELYRERELDEYQRYLLERQREFEAYQRQQQAEFVAFVKEFELAASRSVAFDGRRAYEQANTEAVEAEFAAFEAFIRGQAE